jgi:hypothetical protein
MTVHDADNCVPLPEDGLHPDLLDVGQEHAYTICPDCIPYWAQDYHITLGDTPKDLGLE